jgi:hypothetical protein
MSEVGAIVRLVPEESSRDEKCAKYCVQCCSFSRGSLWENLGVLVIKVGESITWLPFPKFSDQLPDIDVGIKEYLSRGHGRFEKAFDARFRIRRLADGIMKGQAPLGTILPPIFVKIDIPAEAPCFNR